MATFKDLKRQAKEIGLERKEKFLTQRWKKIQEAEIRKLQSAAEADERKLAAEAEERILAAEAEERKLK